MDERADPKAGAPADAYRTRRARPEEADKLARIEVEAAGRFRGTVHAEIADADPHDAVELAQAAAAGLLWVVDLDGEPVGFALAVLLEGAAHLEEMDVLPAHGGRALGARLLEMVCDWASERGDQELTLTTYDDVPWNRAYYERLGFGVIGESRMTDALREQMRAEAAQGLHRSRVAMSRRIDRDPEGDR